MKQKKCIDRASLGLAYDAAYEVVTPVQEALDLLSLQGNDKYV